MRAPQPWFRKQTGQWYVTLNGKQHKLGPIEEEARQKYHELMAEHGQGQVGFDPPVYVLMNLYLAYVEANRSEATLKKYKHQLGRFAKAFGQRLRVSQLKPHHVQSVVDGPTYRRCSSTYKNDAITCVKGVLFWAMDQGYIKHSPIARMKKPTRNVRETFIPGVDWQRVLDAASDDSFREYLTVAFASGARPNEMRIMEATWLEPEYRRIVFPRLSSKGKKRQRVIYLDDVALPIVARLAAENPVGPIFRNRDGKPWKKCAINDRFKRLRKKMKIDGLCATVLRHSYAHFKLTNGTDSLVVSKLLGHVDGRMLATRYGHLDDNPDFLSSEVNRSNPLSPPAIPAPIDMAPPIEPGPMVGF